MMVMVVMVVMMVMRMTVGMKMMVVVSLLHNSCHDMSQSFQLNFC